MSSAYGIHEAGSREINPFCVGVYITGEFICAAFGCAGGRAWCLLLVNGRMHGSLERYNPSSGLTRRSTSVVTAVLTIVADLQFAIAHGRALISQLL